jgi:hypothetical protein
MGDFSRRREYMLYEMTIKLRVRPLAAMTNALASAE